MNKDSQKLDELIKGAQRIFITSHISPDPDAVASLLLVGLALRQNQPGREVLMVLEDEPTDLSFLAGFKEIHFQAIYPALANFRPNLFILLDGNNFDRCSRQDGQKIRDFVKAQNLPTAVIDHHEPAGKDEADIFINNASASTVQDVYAILFDEFGMTKPEGAAQTAMTGFYADTGGFVYVKSGQQRQIFGFAQKLVAEGADIEAVKNQLESYSELDMKVLAQLAGNVSHADDYTYSFLSDEFVTKSGLPSTQIQRSLNAFINNYIRNIDGRKWGFVVYKNMLQGENYYSVSLRSQGGEPDVSLIAQALGGGGHKPAAGAKFEASSIENALAKVMQTISRR